MKIRFRSDGRSECDGSWHGGTSKWTELALQVSCWISDWNTFKWNSIALVFDVRLQRQVESLEIRYKINKSLEFDEIFDKCTWKGLVLVCQGFMPKFQLEHSEN